MKTILFALLALSSVCSFAQRLESVDLILHAEYNEWPGNDHFNIAKVKMTRARYDRMLAEDLMMFCKVNTDKDMKLVFYKGQVTAHHKKSDEPVAHCTATACMTSKFEDLAEETTEAINGYEIKHGVFWEYSISSVAFYEYTRRTSPSMNYPEVSELPYVTFVDPKIHTPQTTPITNTFYCYLFNPKNEIVSP